MRAIIFDYNGVLADDLHLHLEAYCELARRHKSNATPADIKKIAATTTSMAKIELIAGTTDPKVTLPLMKEKTDLYVELAKKKGVLFPDVKKVITSLSKKYLLAMATNSTREQIVRVFPPGLLKKFSVVLTYEEVTKPKPAPESLWEVLKRLSVKKEYACYVGDTPTDIAYAKNAGVLAIGITTGPYTKHQLRQEGADLVIERLSELEEFLRKK